MAWGSTMRPDDCDYYRARAIEERWLVKECGTADVAAIHAELAVTYDELADRIEFKDILAEETLQDACRTID